MKKISLRIKQMTGFIVLSAVFIVALTMLVAKIGLGSGNHEPSALATASGARTEISVPLEYQYTITGSGTSFGVVNGNSSTIANNMTIQNALTAIRTNASGNECAITFGDGEILDIGSTAAAFNNTGGTWGKINLFGRVFSTSSTNTIGITGVTAESSADIYCNSSGRAIYASSGGNLTIIGGEIYNEYTNGSAVQCGTTSTVNITGGKISSVGNAASNATVHNSSAGTINISGETTEITNQTGVAVRNYNNGTINISDGTIRSGNNTAVYNTDSGTINISGGKISSGTGYAIYIYNYTKTAVTVVNISQPVGNITEISSGSANAAIYLYDSGDLTNDRLTISGGKIENTSNTGNVITNNSSGGISISGGELSIKEAESTGHVISNIKADIKISGGTLTAKKGYVFYNNSSTESGSVVLDGSPVINGIIQAKIGKLSVEKSSFVPGENIYHLDFPEVIIDEVAVIDGSEFADSFCFDAAIYKLIIGSDTNANDLVFAYKTFTVTFKDDSGNVLKTETIEYGSSATAPAETPTKEPTSKYNYKFKGWSESYENVTGDLILTPVFDQVAKFNPNVYFYILIPFFIFLFILILLLKRRKDKEKDNKAKNINMNNKENNTSVKNN